MTDDYERTHRALQAMHAPELARVDSIELEAVDNAVVTDAAIDRVESDFKKLANDFRGLRRT